MISKYFELTKLNFETTNYLLLHGKNEGYKNDEITKIKRKLGKKITTYDEKQILDNSEQFIESNLNESLFENDKIILIKRCTDKMLGIVEDLIEKKINDIIFIFDSEILDKKSKLRIFFEKSKKQLVSVAFYPDNFEILMRMAQQNLKVKKIFLSNECISTLISKSGNDRKNLLNEIEKIEMYSMDKKKISNEEVYALINLSENHSVNELINNCLAKKQKKLFRILNDNIFSNEDCIIIIRTLLKKAKNLLSLLDEFYLNKDIEATINHAKPPIFWKEKDIIKDQIHSWSIDKVKRLIVEINNLELQIKKNATSAIYFTTNFLIEKSI